MLTVNKIEPTIVNKLVDKTARDGNNVIFECSVDDPEQDMIWQLNGNQISANREFDINAGNGHHRLAFKALEKFQGAKITCKMDQSNFSKWNWSPRDIQTETSAMLTVQIPDGKLSQIKNFLEKSQISYRQNDLISTCTYMIKILIICNLWILNLVIMIFAYQMPIESFESVKSFKYSSQYPKKCLRERFR